MSQNRNGRSSKSRGPARAPAPDWLQPLASASAMTGFAGRERLGRRCPLLARPTHSRLAQRLIPPDVRRDFARWEPDGRVGGEQRERVE